MECPDINNLKFSREDKDALDEIRRVQRAGNVLELAMPAGVFATIFLGNNAAQVTYNIHSTDWVLFAKAMNSIPDLMRYRIRQVAKLRLLRADLSTQQRRFWDAIDGGCRGY